ncbi:MAG: UDP-N-acetylmuramate dehydrogenase [Clostridiales Family XIII bacterium]|jgi:UDP-N-acetylmuramate dehydrogenase|nr:UDP-N-acetylmuramate dehydrogenase [Clostridiales Family XIII bacterium]
MRETERLIRELNSDPDTESVLADAPMGEYCSFKAGGRADCLFVPRGEAGLLRALRRIRDLGLSYFVMGAGTNLLVRDGGFRGVIVKPGAGMRAVRVDGARVAALCGASRCELATAAATASLGGLEFAHGIPGSVGGAVYMNAGAYGGEIGGVLESARVFLPDEDAVVSLRRAELAFAYRSSLLQSLGGVVLEARFALAPGNGAEIRARMSDFARRRAEKQPLHLPSAGSFFRRPAGGFAGKLIEDAGLSGLSCGGARISPRHSGFIVNEGGATASEIIDLAEIVRSIVFDRFGVMLHPEVRIIGDDIDL